MRWSLLLVVAAGCHAAFPLEDGEAPRECEAWGDPMELIEFAGTPRETDPSLGGDPLEVFFTVADPYLQIMVARRVATNVPFVLPPERASFGVEGFDEGDPAMTEDGTHLLFRSNRGGTDRIWETTRASPAAAFGNVHLVAEVTAEVSSLDISSDGLTLYYVTGANLFSVQRATLAAPFADNPRRVATGLTYPSLSADGLELYYSPEPNSPERIERRVRSSRGAEFGDPAVVINYGGGDADLSPDGTTLIHGEVDTLWMRTRDCE